MTITPSPIPAPREGFGRSADLPAPLALLTDSRPFWVASRIVLTLVFWTAAIGQLIDFSGSVRGMADVGLPAPTLFAVLVPMTLLFGSVAIIVNRLLWLGAGVLGVFLVLTVPVAHPFWSMTGPHQMDEMRLVLEHISLIGGLAFVVLAERARTFDRRAR